ncbi:MAG: hypothetical protein LUQ13_05265 [Methanomicrobiales archaeon]|nr:hypothetical protein [Methanomicrobiales archaeon]
MSVIITGCESMQILEQVLIAARTFRPMNDDTIRSLLARTARSAAHGKYELCKTTHKHDGTVQNPEWMG